MARTKRTTTDPRSAFPIRRMILLDVVLLTTLRLIPNEVLCRRLIHRSAWKVNSANFVCREFLDPLCARTCYNCIYYRVNLSRCRRAATCLPTRLGLATHPTKVPPGRNALPMKRREKGVQAYGADTRTPPSTLREPRNAVRYCLRVASSLSSP